jgi:pimeloyl-ACP methyl ester carboxylesterase
VTIRPTVASAADDPQASPVRTDEVCFTVHNEGDPVPVAVYGVRYYVGDPQPQTKVIVLVHGHSITHAFWDLRPDFSVARNFARAGYLVIAYDRLGYGRSPYERPHGAGYTLTWSSQRAMLHEIVTQVKSGNYTSGSGGTCAGNASTVGLASPTVIVIGHSAGGAIVSGYPGTYHDVAAAVPTGWNNQGLPPDAMLYIGQTLGPEYAKGNDYATLFPTEEGCKTALLYPAGVFPSLLPAFCQNGFVAAPAGEISGATPRAYAENLKAITQVGPHVPVLLAFEDRDFFFPADKNAQEVEYWKAHCGCDVESWTQQGTGHALIAHTSMPTFTSKVAAWLESKGLGAK